MKLFGLALTACILPGFVVVEASELEQKPRDAKLEFQRVASKAGRFMAEMPGKPEEKAQELATSRGKMKYFQFEVNAANDSLQFNIAYFDQFDDVVKGKVPQDLILAFRNGARKGQKIIEDKEITLGKDKIPGRDYQVETKNGLFIRERMFIAGNRHFRVFIVVDGPKEFLTSKDANRFFDSFKITK